MDLSGFKSLLTNEKAQLVYQLPSHSNSKSSLTCRPPSSQRLAFPARREIHAPSRLFHTESDRMPTQEDQQKSELVPGNTSRVLIRPKSAIFKPVDPNLEMRQTLLKQSLSKANIKATTKLKLDNFYDSILKVKMEGEKLNSMIDNLQYSFELSKTRSTWNPNKTLAKDMSRNIKSSQSQRSIARLHTDGDERQFTPNKELDSALPSTLKLTPAPSHEVITPNLNKEAVTPASRKSLKRPSSGKDELFAATMLKENHYNTFVKAYQGVKNDLQICSSRERAKPVRIEDNSTGTSNLLRVKDITERARQGDHLLIRNEGQEDAKDASGPGESTLMLMTSRSSIDLNVSGENGGEQKNRKPNFANTQNVFVNQKDFNGHQAVSPRKGTPKSPQRSTSVRKAARPPTANIFGNEYKEKMEIINQTIYLQGAGYEGGSKTHRQYTPSKAEDYYAQPIKSYREEPNNIPQRPILMILGQKFSEEVMNQKMLRRAVSNPRDAKPVEKEKPQYVTFQKGIKGLGPLLSEKNLYKRPMTGIKRGSTLGKAYQKLGMEAREKSLLAQASQKAI